MDDPHTLTTRPEQGLALPAIPEALPTVKTAKMAEGDPVLNVECGPNRAVLHLDKLREGSRGKSVFFRDTWLTPNEFQFVSGRQSAKDWKRSIRHYGKTLKWLIANGAVVMDPPGCGCQRCHGNFKEPDPEARAAAKRKCDVTEHTGEAVEAKKSCAAGLEAKNCCAAGLESPPMEGMERSDLPARPIPPERFADGVLTEHKEARVSHVPQGGGGGGGGVECTGRLGDCQQTSPVLQQANREGAAPPGLTPPACHLGGFQMDPCVSRGGMDAKEHEQVTRDQGQGLVMAPPEAPSDTKEDRVPSIPTIPSLPSQEERMQGIIPSIPTIPSLPSQEERMQGTIPNITTIPTLPSKDERMPSVPSRPSLPFPNPHPGVFFPQPRSSQDLPSAAIQPTARYNGAASPANNSTAPENVKARLSKPQDCAAEGITGAPCAAPEAPAVITRQGAPQADCSSLDGDSSDDSDCDQLDENETGSCARTSGNYCAKNRWESAQAKTTESKASTVDQPEYETESKENMTSTRERLPADGQDAVSPLCCRQPQQQDYTSTVGVKAEQHSCTDKLTKTALCSPVAYSPTNTASSAADMQRRLGDTGRQAGDMERHQGDMERHQGDMDRHAGDTDRHGVDMERHKGDMDRRPGDTERRPSDVTTSSGITSSLLSPTSAWTSPAAAGAGCSMINTHAPCCSCACVCRLHGHAWCGCAQAPSSASCPYHRQPAPAPAGYGSFSSAMYDYMLQQQQQQQLQKRSLASLTSLAGPYMPQAEKYCGQYAGSALASLGSPVGGSFTDPRHWLIPNLGLPSLGGLGLTATGEIPLDLSKGNLAESALLAHNFYNLRRGFHH